MRGTDCELQSWFRNSSPHDLLRREQVAFDQVTAISRFILNLGAVNSKRARRTRVDSPSRGAGPGSELDQGATAAREMT